MTHWAAPFCRSAVAWLDEQSIASNLRGVPGPGHPDQGGEGPSGTDQVEVDLTHLPRPTGPLAVQPGDRWNFQLWYRDSTGGTATFNLTDPLEVNLL